MIFSVWIARPADDAHWQGLLEVAQGVRRGLEQAGHSVSGTDDCLLGVGRPVVFNAHRIPRGHFDPSEAIVYNSEQVQLEGEIGEAWAASPYLELLRRAGAVWDYSETNIERLKKLGVSAILCRVGHYPALTRVQTHDEDVDVLHFGCLNERRERLLAQIGLRGLRVKSLFGVYGAERDAWIARAKIVLCAHYYPRPIFEIFRCSFLYANRKCVVSEANGVDSALESLAATSGAHVPYDQIPGLCASLARDKKRREDIAERGFQTFAKIDQAEEVRRALVQTDLSGNGERRE